VGFAGKIALIQRGTCNFGVKVLNATQAGAVGVVIFNEGNPGRTAVFSGSMSDADGNPFVASIPVAFTSFDIGQSLYNQYTAGTPPVMSLSIHQIVDPNRTDWNVIAESKGGDPNHVVVVDAHLDAIYGAGMLDNASGSAAILDIAQKMRKAHPLNKLRFIWFGGEELGELGSKYYVNNLSASELGKIRYDLDADVLATPNYSIGILDPAAVDLFGRTVSETFPPQVYEPSKVARDMGVDYFNSIGKNHIFFSPKGTDAEQFQLAGVPASGVLTGQDCCKTQEEVDLFGGYTGNYEGNVPSFDGGCVDNPFRWCDNLSNNDPNVLTFMSKAFADMTVRMAYDRSVVWAGEDAHKPKGRPAAAGRRSNPTRLGICRRRAASPPGVRRSRARYSSRECRSHADPTLAGARRAVVRARRHGGRAARARRARMQDRHAARAGARRRCRDTLAAVLRTTPQGRRLLGELGEDGGAVRRRRSRRQADLQARRLVEPLPGLPLVGADGGASPLARGSSEPAAGDQGRG
jgi:hypothetical protein